MTHPIVITSFTIDRFVCAESAWLMRVRVATVLGRSDAHVCVVRSGERLGCGA